MKEKLAVLMTIFSICLLVTYGLDVLFSNISQGFLPFNHMIRGIGFGVPSIILPLFSFLLTKNLISKKLGILLIINGSLIILGGVAVVIPTKSNDNIIEIRTYIESLFLIIIGSLTVFLGIKKIK